MQFRDVYLSCVNNNIPVLGFLKLSVICLPGGTPATTLSVMVLVEFYHMFCKRNVTKKKLSVKKSIENFHQYLKMSEHANKLASWRWTWCWMEQASEALRITFANVATCWTHRPDEQTTRVNLANETLMNSYLVISY